MQVLITVAGVGARFAELGFLEPKPAITLAGRPAISYLIQSFPKEFEFIFVLGEHFRNSGLDKIILSSAPLSQIVYTPYSVRGPIDTVLAGIPYLKQDQPVIVSYCDVGFICDWSSFIKNVSLADFAFFNYQGFHPTYFGSNSYCHVKVDSLKNEVIDIQEKQTFGSEIEKEITSLGLYYFKNSNLLQNSLKAQVEQNLKYGQEFYISLAVKAFKNKFQSAQIFDFRVDHLLQLGTPADIERFQFWYEQIVMKKTDFEFKLIDQANRPIHFDEKLFELEKKYWLQIFQFFSIT